MIKRNLKMDVALPSTLNAILLLFHYFVGYMYIYPQLGMAITYVISGQRGAIYQEIAYMIYAWMIFGSLILAKPYFKESWKMSSSHFFSHLFKAIKLYIPLYLTLLIISPVIQILTQSDSTGNQTMIEEAFTSSPFSIIFAALIMAPLVEEIVFRGALYRTLRNHRTYKFAIVISSVSFGFIHVFNSLLLGQFQDLYSIILYSAMGFFFVKAYEETASILPAIFLHFLVNGVGVFVIYLVGR